MSDDPKCVCGHKTSTHLWSSEPPYERCQVPGCRCGGLQIAEEAKPEPETVYERARKAAERLGVPGSPDDDDRAIVAALDAGEAAEKRAEAAEHERDEARTEWSKLQESYAYEINRVHDLIIERDALKARVAELEAHKG